MRPPLSVTASASMRAVACAASVAYATSAVHAAAGDAGRHSPPRIPAAFLNASRRRRGRLGRPRLRLAEVAPRGHGYGRERPKAFPPVSVRRRSGRTIQDCASYDFEQLGAIGLGRSDFSDIVVEARSRMAHRVENLADPDFGQIFEHRYLSLRRAERLEVDYEGAAEFRGRTVGEIFRVPIIVSRRLVQVKIGTLPIGREFGVATQGRVLTHVKAKLDVVGKN